MNKGKAYANRKPEAERSPNDFYPTPRCMVQELLNFHHLSYADEILDPCCGKYAIGNVLRENGYGQPDNGYGQLTERDLIYGDDFLKKDETGNIIIGDEHFDAVVMNPPFKSFNAFVEKSKKIANRVYCIGKMNFFGAHDRNVNGLWEHLEWVLPFDRQIAFDKPEHEDGKVEMGMMITGWFIWNNAYEGYPKIKVLDMQKYAYHKGKKV